MGENGRRPGVGLRRKNCDLREKNYPAHRNRQRRIFVEEGSMTSLEIKEVPVADTPLISASAPQRKFINFNIDPDLGVMEMDNVQSRYFGVGNTHFRFKHDVMVVPEGSRQVHFGLAIMENYKGVVQFDGREWIDVNHGESYLTFNTGVSELHRFVANQSMKVNFFNIESNYLTNILLDQQPGKGTQLYNFRESVINNRFAGVRTKTSSATKNIIAAIYNCPLDGSLGNMMLEGALQQVLALELSSLGSETAKPSAITHRDRDVMTAVKEYLDVSFNEDHSLYHLSKRFGINQNKLKTRFRELFGVPVITYLYDLRMEHARMLLLDKGMFVSEVSSMVGYRNSNHFATAFKRKFGVNPSRLKS